MWRLSGELAVNCSTLVDLPRQTHGLRWMRDELMAPPDLRLTLNGADDVQDTVRSDKYPGAAPFKQPCTSTHNLYWMRCGTRSQCKSIRSCVTWSYLRASAMRRASALTTDCTRSSSYCGMVQDFFTGQLPCPCCLSLNQQC